MQIHEHYGLIRPIDYDNLIAGEFELWATNSMGVPDKAIFSVYEPRLTKHAQKYVNTALELGYEVSFRLRRREGMLRVEFLSKEGKPIHLKDIIAYGDAPKFSHSTVRQFVELVLHHEDDNLAHSKEFGCFLDMLLEDLEPAKIGTLVKAFPFLSALNERFDEYTTQ